MPLAFPSHQGFVLPLVRRWPRHFDALALCVGAAMPDVVDGFLGLGRGDLGQWYGHTLLGTVVLCWPAGLLLTRLLRVVTAHLSRRFESVRRMQRTFVRLAHPSATHVDATESGLVRNGLVFISLSVWIGALSHLLLDFVSHGNCLWLYPFRGNMRVFPSWWHTAWFEIPLPWYEEPYPFGPHLLIWIALTILGAFLFFAPVLRRSRPVRPGGTKDEVPLEE
ncbi:MAG: DUF4184 family protein [Planctomycetes bacterium]|nr:DUF4184 family protein [Planctomycetota bacterium]